MAIPAGLEPATYCLEGSCSIQLSYGTLYSVFLQYMKKVNYPRIYESVARYLKLSP